MITPGINIGPEPIEPTRLSQSISDWFANLWVYLDGVAYWLALCICITAFIFYVATKHQKFRNTIVITILSFLMIKAVGWAI